MVLPVMLRLRVAPSRSMFREMSLVRFSLAMMLSAWHWSTLSKIRCAVAFKVVVVEIVPTVSTPDHVVIGHASRAVERSAIVVLELGIAAAWSR